jgi:hypothetical protein
MWAFWAGNQVWAIIEHRGSYATPLALALVARGLDGKQVTTAPNAEAARGHVKHNIVGLSLDAYDRAWRDFDYESFVAVYSTAAVGFWANSGMTRIPGDGLVKTWMIMQVNRSTLMKLASANAAATGAGRAPFCCCLN